MLALAAIAAGCGGDLAPLLCDGGRCGTQSSWRKTYQTTINRKVDLLFVVDDTAAMAPHRDALAAGFTAMAPRLRDMTAPTSLHVGFIRAGSCDTSTRGAACGVITREQFLRSEWCHTIDNFADAYEHDIRVPGGSRRGELRARPAARDGAPLPDRRHAARMGRLPAARRLPDDRRRHRPG